MEIEKLSIKRFAFISFVITALLVSFFVFKMVISPFSLFLEEGDVRLLNATKTEEWWMNWRRNTDNVHHCDIALQGWKGDSLHYQIENCYLSADGWHKYTMNVDTEPQIIAELPEGIYPNPTSVATIRQKRVSADGKYTAILLNEPSGSPELVIYVVD